MTQQVRKISLQNAGNAVSIVFFNLTLITGIITSILAVMLAAPRIAAGKRGEWIIIVVFALMTIVSGFLGTAVHLLINATNTRS